VQQKDCRGMGERMKEKMTRREFVKLCLKSALFAGMFSLLPRLQGFGEDEDKKFTIKTKPFRRCDLSRKDDLAG